MCLTPFKVNLLQLLEKTLSLEGDVIELGAYQGVTTLLLAQTLKEKGSTKKVYACDTYCGHPYDDYPEAKHKSGRKGAFGDTSVNFVTQFLADVSHEVVVVEGMFEQTLPQLEGKFCFAFVDCDLYQSTEYALNFLKERMVKDGIIAFHDYGDAYRRYFGLTDAVDNWCSKNGFHINLEPVPHIEM